MGPLFDSGGRENRKRAVLTIGDESNLQSWMSRLVSSLSPVPSQVVVAAPLSFVRGHLFTLTETLWTLVPHAKLSIRLRFGGLLRPEGPELARYTAITIHSAQ